MASKQGGKGKTSSPSRRASHLRAKARSAAKKPGPLPHFPHVSKPRPATKVVLNGPTPRQVIFPIFQAYVAGVLVEQSEKESDCLHAISDAGTRYSSQLFRLHENGRREALAARNWN